jgi:hypothetical protein
MSKFDGIGRFGFVANLISEDGRIVGAKFKIKLLKPIGVIAMFTRVVSSDGTMLSVGDQCPPCAQAEIERYRDIGLSLADIIRRRVGGHCSYCVSTEEDDLVIAVRRISEDNLDSHPVPYLCSATTDIAEEFADIIS